MCIAVVTDSRQKEKEIRLFKSGSFFGVFLVTFWTVAHQTPLFMEFSRLEYWAGCHLLLQGIFLTQGSNPCLLNWQVDTLLTSGRYSSVAPSCPTLCNRMDCNMPVLPVHHQFPELTQTHVHWVGDAIQPSHPLSFLSPPALALNHSQHQGLFKWVRSSHQVAKVLQFQLQHQSFQWIFRIDFL